MSEQAPFSSPDRGTNGAGLSRPTSVECVVLDTVWTADTDDLPQVTTVMCIETVRLCFRQAPSAHVVRKLSTGKTNAE